VITGERTGTADAWLDSAIDVEQEGYGRGAAVPPAVLCRDCAELLSQLDLR